MSTTPGTDEHIELSDADSVGATQPPVFPDGAPNVVVIMLDDLGFAQLGCYGSEIATPNIDRLAGRGLRFTNFHTTAVCSPTRACLLTGRNHHRVGVGMLIDLPRNFDGYRAAFPRSAGTMADVLRSNGWATLAIGKWHLTPTDQRAAGPYDMWPLGVGFDRYYGFLNGETNQWTPNLIRDNTHIEPPATPADGYHLDADLADEAIAQLAELRRAHSRRPFFLYYATGTPHAPHQVPPEWIEPYEGQFDDGWDVARERTLDRQKALGIVPPGVELSERPSWVEAWDSIPADRQRLYARMMEVYAGFVTHADHHIGRVLDAIEASGELDNTIVALVSDNGASAEGGPNGAYNQLGHYLSDEDDDLELELAHIDDLGGHRSSCHYPWGWALAGNTPLRKWKRYTHEGGVRDPLIISWPAGMGEQGVVRDQYSHVTDIMPTVLEAAGIPVPDELDGVAQMSLDGASLLPVFGDPSLATPHPEQYYECWGSRAMYQDGWKAVTNHVNQLTLQERTLMEGSADFAEDSWELFNTDEDFTESVDLATTHPEKLAEMIALWNSHAARNNVLPLSDGRGHEFGNLYMPWLDVRSNYRFAVGERVHMAATPILAGEFRMVAAFDTPVGGDCRGVIAEQGDWIHGWAWYCSSGSTTWVYADRYGPHKVTVDVPAEARLLVVTGVPDDAGHALTFETDSGVIGSGRIDRRLPFAWSPDGAFLTVGSGRPFPVCTDYEPPAPISAALADLTIDIGPPPPLDMNAELERLMRHQ